MTGIGNEDDIIRNYTEPDFADAELEHWLKTEVVEAIRELEQNPDSSITLTELYQKLAAEHPGHFKENSLP